MENRNKFFSVRLLSRTTAGIFPLQELTVQSVLWPKTGRILPSRDRKYPPLRFCYLPFTRAVIVASPLMIKSMGNFCLYLLPRRMPLREELVSPISCCWFFRLEGP